MKIPTLRTRRRARIEIIPLIDIVFFLLATFVMVSLSMVQNQGISVKLPVASTSEKQDRKAQAVITVTDDGVVYFNKQKTDTQGLTNYLRDFKAANPDPKIFINGDEKALFGQTIKILDEIRKLGITKIAIQTKVESK